MRKRWLLLALLSVGLLTASAPCLRAAEEEDEGKEVKIKFSECPPAVQKTLMRESFGAKIASVDKETRKDGKIVYEADVMIDDTNYEIQVSPEGKLIVKKIDNEADEAKEKGKNKSEKEHEGKEKD
jgi:hypothetical protein